MLNDRAKRLVAALPEDFEAAIISTEVNRFYLLDFDAGDAGTLVLFPYGMVYIIDSRYIEVARRDVRNAQVVLEGAPLSQMADVLRDAGVTKVHLETGMTLGEAARLKEKIPFVEYVTDSTLSDSLAELRQIKDAEELARMRRAQAITDACFEHILPLIKEGVREIDLCLEMEFFMRKNGADDVAFPTISVAGPNTSLPHGVPGGYAVKPGDFITMDYGAKCRGYCSDMTRTVALGEPGEEKRRLYNTVLRAHLAGIEAARPGAKGSDVDGVARGIIGESEFKGTFAHGLGHSLGIEVHESPRFSPKCHDVIEAGMLMTVEPGIYLAGRCGCRIEDTVLITEMGCEPLPKSPKELIVL